MYQVHLKYIIRVENMILLINIGDFKLSTGTIFQHQRILIYLQLTHLANGTTFC